LFEVDLGGGLCKKRVAVAGQGKSGSVRTLIAMEHEKAIFFLMGRKKSDSGSDFTDKVVNANKVMAGWLGAVTTDNLADMLANGALKEICHEQ
jgi:hypothetical protein